MADTFLPGKECQVDGLPGRIDIRMGPFCLSQRGEGCADLIFAKAKAWSEPGKGWCARPASARTVRHAYPPW